MGFRGPLVEDHCFKLILKKKTPPSLEMSPLDVNNVFSTFVYEPSGLLLIFLPQVSAAVEMMERLKKELKGKERELNEQQQSVSEGFCLFLQQLVNLASKRDRFLRHNTSFPPTSCAFMRHIHSFLWKLKRVSRCMCTGGLQVALQQLPVS